MCKSKLTVSNKSKQSLRTNVVIEIKHPSIKKTEEITVEKQVYNISCRFLRFETFFYYEDNIRFFSQLQKLLNF
jgi:hypothetical protein